MVTEDNMLISAPRQVRMLDDNAYSAAAVLSPSRSVDSQLNNMAVTQSHKTPISAQNGYVVLHLTSVFLTHLIMHDNDSRWENSEVVSDMSILHAQNK